MTNDELIRMAKEAGLPRWYQTDEVVNMDLLGRFAALVAAHEREACAFDADWCIQNHLEHLIAERIRARGQA